MSVRNILSFTTRPADIVIMDNLGSHKSRAVRDAIRSAGARRLFLPAYSPDLNPIELAISKLKALLRKTRARTFDAVSDAISNIIDQFWPDECANFFDSCGYGSA